MVKISIDSTLIKSIVNLPFDDFTKNMNAIVSGYSQARDMLPVDFQIKNAINTEIKTCSTISSQSITMRDALNLQNRKYDEYIAETYNELFSIVNEEVKPNINIVNKK